MDDFQMRLGCSKLIKEDDFRMGIAEALFKHVDQETGLEKEVNLLASEKNSSFVIRCLLS